MISIGVQVFFPVTVHITLISTYFNMFLFLLQIQFQAVTTKSKNVPFTYSEMLNKLFVKAQAKFPVFFLTESQVPPGAFLQIMLIYTRSADCKEVVKRCQHHMELEKGNLIVHLYK